MEARLSAPDCRSDHRHSGQQHDEEAAKRQGALAAPTLGTALMLAPAPLTPARHTSVQQLLDGAGQDLPLHP